MPGEIDWDFGHAIWRCACGALGANAMLLDLDEIGDMLATRLHLDVRVSEPPVPVGTSGMIYATPFHPANALDALKRALEDAGYAVRTREVMLHERLPGMEIFARRME